MNHLVSQFICRLNSFNPMNSELPDMVQRVARVGYYKKGEHLLKEGEICDKAGLLVKGWYGSTISMEEKILLHDCWKMVQLLQRGLAITGKSQVMNT